MTFVSLYPLKKPKMCNVLHIALRVVLNWLKGRCQPRFFKNPVKISINGSAVDKNYIELSQFEMSITLASEQL